MNRTMLHLSVTILTLTSGAVFCLTDSTEKMEPQAMSLVHKSAHQQPSHIIEIPETDGTDSKLVYKRSPGYNFGLGKRAYSYLSNEYKRLPVYNFGLGKRARTYSFGLGKRSVDSNSFRQYDDEDNSWDNMDEHQDWSDQFEDETSGAEEKRARPYSFGLGKRFRQSPDSEEYISKRYNFGLGKRAAPSKMYSFGLGKRTIPSKMYSFGLGKRAVPNHMYNFGLGKRERDLNRFNFGLGKRAADYLTDFSTDIDSDDVEA